MMISYAQNLEDVVLERVFRTQPTGFYIDVGAWDPDCDSVTKHFYLKGWSGINVEPTAFYFDRLLTVRPRDINLRVAVGNQGVRTADFLQIDGTGWSGFAETSSRHVIEKGGDAVRAITVNVMPLSEITSRYAPAQVDFLKIDVEGAERSVIESAEWQAFRPRVVVVEAVAPITNQPAWFGWEGLLLEVGYRLALFDGLNRFYYRAEEPELRDALSVPANVLDEYCQVHFVAMQQRLAGLEALVTQRPIASNQN